MTTMVHLSLQAPEPTTTLLKISQFTKAGNSSVPRTRVSSKNLTRAPASAQASTATSKTHEISRRVFWKPLDRLSLNHQPAPSTFSKHWLIYRHQAIMNKSWLIRILRIPLGSGRRIRLLGTSRNGLRVMIRCRRGPASISTLWNLV